MEMRQVDIMSIHYQYCLNLSRLLCGSQSIKFNLVLQTDLCSCGTKTALIRVCMILPTLVIIKDLNPGSVSTGNHMRPSTIKD